MPVCQLQPEQLRIGRPTPYGLRDASGSLLMMRGAVIESAAQRQLLIERGVYVDEEDTEAYARAMAGKMDALLRQDARLGRIAQARPDGQPNAVAAPVRGHSEPQAVIGELQTRLGKLLREAPQADFAARLHKVQDELLSLAERDADVAMLVLVDATASDTHRYSVTHALLVAVVCELAARQLPSWPTAWREPLRCAALTMNIAMTVLQDTLAQQPTPPDPQQREQIESHAERAATGLQAAGIDDALWVEAVRHHHDAAAGALASFPPALQLARLIRRADLFAAVLSRRRKRTGLAGAAAAKAAYLDEQRQVDEAGAAIIKAVGIYPPGSCVRLASTEVAVVLRRGQRANEPLVASVLSRAGTPLGDPVLRDTREPRHAVLASVAPHELRLRVDAERLLRLL